MNHASGWLIWGFFWRKCTRPLENFSTLMEYDKCFLRLVWSRQRIIPPGWPVCKSDHQLLTRSLNHSGKIKIENADLAEIENNGGGRTTSKPHLPDYSTDCKCHWPINDRPEVTWLTLNVSQDLEQLSIHKVCTLIQLTHTVTFVEQPFFFWPLAILYDIFTPRHKSCRG